MSGIALYDNKIVGEKYLKLNKYVDGSYFVYKVNENNYFIHPERIPEYVWLDQYDQENSFNIKVGYNNDFDYRVFYRIVTLSDWLDEEDVFKEVKKFITKNNSNRFMDYIKFSNDILYLKFASLYKYDIKKAKHEQKIMKKNESFRYPIGIEKSIDLIKRYDFGLVKEDYIRLSFILDELTAGETGTVSYELGKLIRNMFEEGISHADINPFNISVKKNEYGLFDLKIADAEHAHPITKPYLERFIIDEYHALSSTIGDSITNIVKKLLMNNHNALVYFIYGLVPEIDKKDAILLAYEYTSKKSNIAAYVNVAGELAYYLYNQLF